MANAAVTTQRVPRTFRTETHWLRVGLALILGGFLVSLFLTSMLRDFWDGSIGEYPSQGGILFLTVVIVGGLLLTAVGTAAVVEGIRRRLGASRFGAIAIGGAIGAPVWVAFYGFFGLGQYRSITDSSPASSFEAAEWLVLAPFYFGLLLVVAGLLAAVSWSWRRLT